MKTFFSFYAPVFREWPPQTRRLSKLSIQVNMFRTLIPLILVASSSALPTTRQEKQPILILLKYAYNSYLKVMADLHFSIPS